METEWALLPADAADLQDLLDGGFVRPAAAGPGLECTMPEPLGITAVFTRLYWGDAFCRYLLPTRAEHRQAQGAARRYGLDLTLATPPLADPELPALRDVLSWLDPGEEVEVNDWGVLRLVSREFPNLVPVLGRGLLKVLKDPRREGGDRQPAVSTALAGLLRRHGVRMVTADTLAVPGDFALAVVLPYQFVSSGRICLIGATSLDTPQRFSLAAPCRHECRDFMLDLRTADWHLVQKGNTVFAPGPPDHLAAIAAAFRAGLLNRAVYASGVDRDRRFLRGAGGPARRPPRTHPLDGPVKLLTPVSNPEEVEPLIRSGAEEIYCGVVPAAWLAREDPAHWLNRRSAKGANLQTLDQLAAVVRAAHDREVPVFLTLNAHHYQERQVPAILDMAATVAAVGVDALIVSDLTLICALRDAGIPTAVHLSSLGVCINREAARFYADLGVKRIILPRHLSLADIDSVVTAVPDLEFEVFLLNDGCVYEEGHCLTTHEWGAFCLESWDFGFRPLGEEAALRHANNWEATLADYQRFRWFQNNAGCSTSARGLPQGPCSLCFVPRFAAAGVASLKVVGREAAAVRKLASVQLASAVLRTWRETQDAAAVTARARGLRDAPELCGMGYMCYFR